MIRDDELELIYNKPLWDENDMAVILDVKVGTIRHMLVRHEIPCVVRINKRCWRISQEAFLEYFYDGGKPSKKRGRPRGSKKGLRRD